MMSVLTREGEGVAPSVPQYLLYLRGAARQGLTVAQTELGRLYARGRLLPRDLVQARELLRAAGNAGEVAAMKELARLPAGLSAPQREDDARFWWGRAAAAGDPEGLCEAAEHCEDSTRRIELLRRAGDLDCAEALRRLGELYRLPPERAGPRRDCSKSAGYLSRACELWRAQATRLREEATTREAKWLHAMREYDEVLDEELAAQRVLAAWHDVAARRRLLLRRCVERCGRRSQRSAWTRWCSSASQLTLRQRSLKVAPLSTAVLLQRFFTLWRSLITMSANIRICEAASKSQRDRRRLHKTFRAWCQLRVRCEDRRLQACSSLLAALAQLICRSGCLRHWRVQARRRTGIVRLARWLRRQCVDKRCAPALGHWQRWSQIAAAGPMEQRRREAEAKLAVLRKASEELLAQHSRELRLWQRKYEDEQVLVASLNVGCNGHVASSRRDAQLAGSNQKVSHSVKLERARTENSKDERRLVASLINVGCGPEVANSHRDGQAVGKSQISSLNAGHTAGIEGARNQFEMPNPQSRPAADPVHKRANMSSKLLNDLRLEISSELERIGPVLRRGSAGITTASTMTAPREDSRRCHSDLKQSLLPAGKAGLNSTALSFLGDGASSPSALQAAGRESKGACGDQKQCYLPDGTASCLNATASFFPTAGGSSPSTLQAAGGESKGSSPNTLQDAGRESKGAYGDQEQSLQPDASASWLNSTVPPASNASRLEDSVSACIERLEDRLKARQRRTPSGAMDHLAASKSTGSKSASRSSAPRRHSGNTSDSASLTNTSCLGTHSNSELSSCSLRKRRKRDRKNDGKRSKGKHENPHGCRDRSSSGDSRSSHRSRGSSSKSSSSSSAGFHRRGHGRSLNRESSNGSSSSSSYTGSSGSLLSSSRSPRCNRADSAGRSRAARHSSRPPGPVVCRDSSLKRSYSGKPVVSVPTALAASPDSNGTARRGTSRGKHVTTTAGTSSSTRTGSSRAGLQRGSSAPAPHRWLPSTAMETALASPRAACQGDAARRPAWRR